MAESVPQLSGSLSSSSEELKLPFYDAGGLKEALYDAIEDVAVSRTFACGRDYARLPDPQLSVAGTGPVVLPLSPTDTIAIAGHAKRSPLVLEEDNGEGEAEGKDVGEIAMDVDQEPVEEDSVAGKTESTGK
jgi:hypothetical protein